MKLLALLVAFGVIDIALTLNTRRLIINHHKKQKMDLQDVSAELDVLKSKVDKNNALLAELKSGLDAAKANSNNPAEIQALIDKIKALETSVDTADAAADPNATTSGTAAGSTGSDSGAGSTDGSTPQTATDAVNG